MVGESNPSHFANKRKQKIKVKKILEKKKKKKNNKKKKKEKKRKRKKEKDELNFIRLYSKPSTSWLFSYVKEHIHFTC